MSWGYDAGTYYSGPYRIDCTFRSWFCDAPLGDDDTFAAAQARCETHRASRRAAAVQHLEGLMLTAKAVCCTTALLPVSAHRAQAQRLLDLAAVGKLYVSE